MNICRVKREHEATKLSIQIHVSSKWPGICVNSIKTWPGICVNSIKTTTCVFAILAYFTCWSQPKSPWKCCYIIKISFFLHWISLNKMASAVNFWMWAATWDFQQCGMCYQQTLRPAYPYGQSALIRAFARCLNILWLLSYRPTSFGVSKLKKRLHRLVWVYLCQKASLLEITCCGSNFIWSRLSQINNHAQCLSIQNHQRNNQSGPQGFAKNSGLILSLSS